MPASRLYLPLVIIAAACSDAAPTELDAPNDLEPSFSGQEELIGDYPKEITFSDGVTAIAPDCKSEPVSDQREVTSRCVVKVGETHLLGWLIPGGAQAVMGIRSPAQIGFVVSPAEMDLEGPTDTIPGPPAPGPVSIAIRLAGGDEALSTMFAAAGFDAEVPTDTIPGPPAPFVFVNGDKALMVFSVQDLANKGVLRQTSETDDTPLKVIWTTGSGRSTQSWAAVGYLPPTDTIPGPPAPEKKKSSR